MICSFLELLLPVLLNGFASRRFENKKQNMNRYTLMLNKNNRYHIICDANINKQTMNPLKHKLNIVCTRSTQWKRRFSFISKKTEFHVANCRGFSWLT